MNSNHIGVKVVGDAKMATESLHGLSKSFTVLGRDGKRADSTITGLTKSLFSLKGIVGAVSLYKLTNMFAGFTKSAMDMTESIHLFNVAMGDMAEDTEKVVTAMSAVSGLDNTKLLDTVGSYNLLARSMGVTAKNAQVLSVNTSKLAIDLSALTNRSIQKVSEDLRSGLIGQAKTMYKYGIDVTEASIKQEALNRGITKSVRHMSQAEKMTLRYAVMIRQASLSHGDFSKTIETPANQLRILSERMLTLGRTIGTMFIPIISKVLPWINALVVGLTRLARILATLFGYKGESPIKNIENDFMGGADGADDLADSVGGAGKQVDKLKKKMQALAGFDELNILGTKQPDPSDVGGGGGGGGGDLGGFDIDLEGYDNLFDGLNQKSDELVENFMAKMEELKTAISDFYSDWGMKNLFEKSAEGIKLIDFNSIGENFGRAFLGLGEISQAMLENLQPIFQAGGEMLGTFFKYGIAIVGNLFEPFSEGFANFVENTKSDTIAWIEETSGTIVGIFKNITGIFETIGELILETIEKYKPNIAERWEEIFTNMSNTSKLFITIITDTFDIIIQTIADFIEDNKVDIGQFIDDVFDIFDGGLELINKVWEDSLDLLKDFWNNWGKGILEDIGEVFTDIGGWFTKLWQELVKPVWDKMLEWLNKLWDETFKDVLKTIGDTVGEIGTFIKFLWDKVFKPLIDLILSELVPQLRNHFETILDFIGVTFTGIGTFVTGFMTALQGVLQFIRGVFTGDWKLAWQGISNIFGGIWDGLVGLVKVPLNYIITIINNFLRNLNRIQVPDWVPVVGGKGFNMKEIPHLARGGMMDIGSLFVAGESGAELIGSHRGSSTVMPLEDSGFVEAMGKAVYSAVVSANGGKDNGGIIIQIGERTILDTLTQGVNRETRINGKSVIRI